jgi:hypothetical protein
VPLVVLDGIFIALGHGLLQTLEVVLHFLKIDVLLIAWLQIDFIPLFCTLTRVASLAFVEVVCPWDGLFAFLFRYLILK